MLRTQREIYDAIGVLFDTDHRYLTEEPVKVRRRAGGQLTVWALEIQGEAAPFNADRVGMALATWSRLQQEGDYFRIQHLGTQGRAVFDLVSGSAGGWATSMTTFTTSTRCPIRLNSGRRLSNA